MLFRSELEAYVEKEDNEPLLSEAPKAGKIVGKSYNEELGATIFELSNGAKAIFKKTDFKKNEIIFSAIRQGGSSSFGKDDAINAKLYSEIIDLGVVGNYSKTDLQKKLAGKNIEIAGVCNPIR